MRIPLTCTTVLCAFVLSGCSLVPLPDRHGPQALGRGDRLVGAWLGEWPADSARIIEDFEDATGARLDMVDVYMDWYTPFDNVSHTLQHIAQRGSMPILTWEAQTVTTPDILDGTRRMPLRNGENPTIDAYLEEVAIGTCRIARQHQTPILIRVLHEMNGNWFAWGITYEENGHRPNSGASYARAWIKIHDAFTSRCQDSVRFVWAINHYSIGQGASFTGAYPGDDYVDFIAIDGYNWGSRADWGWQGFVEIFRPGYCALTRNFTKPVLIAEVSSAEEGGDKAAWIQDMFRQFDANDRIRGFVWFNHAKHEIEVEGTMNWRVDSSPAALQTFSAGVQHFQGPSAENAAPEAPPAAETTLKC